MFIIKFKELVGKNPPEEIKVIDKFNPLNSLISLNDSIKKIIKVNIEYKKNIFKDIFFILPSGFKLLSVVKTRLFNLYLNCELEKKKYQKNQKIKSPNPLG